MGLRYENSMQHQAQSLRMARFLVSNSEYDHPYTVNGASKVLFKGMVCVYLQEKHKAKSEKDKKNMGTALETHFNTIVS